MGLLPGDLASARVSFATKGTRDEAVARLSGLVERAPRFFAETWTGEVTPQLGRETQARDGYRRALERGESNEMPDPDRHPWKEVEEERTRRDGPKAIRATSPRST